MTKIFNRRVLGEIRKNLRSNQTYPEQILWSILRGKQLGIKFRRQHSIGNYIVDFYCPEKKLVIELDGDSHFENNFIQEQDKKRDQELMNLGLKILRFTNKDVHESLEGVIDKIGRVIHDASATPSSSPLERGRNRLPKIIAVVGPTASGKSALALAIAKAFDGEIVSVDSRQIYQGMDIGTAKEPGIWDEERKAWMVEDVPHWGINLVRPDAPYSVADFQTYARCVIEDILSHKRLPILVGGTGLWLSAVIEAYDLAKTVPDQAWRAAQSGKTAEELFTEYQKQDPEGAQKIDRFNSRRLLRALEVVQQTGKSFFAQQQNHEPLYDVLKIGLCPDRAILYERINARVDRMMQEGLLEEVRHLQGCYGCDFPSMSGIGYRQLCRHLCGEMTLAQAVEDIKKDTRHYAKRQWTWWKRDQTIHWIKTAQEAQELAKSFLR